MTATVHVVEPGGWGGVYQHAAGLADALAGAGVPVLFHTAAEPEDVGAPLAARHACFWHVPGVRPAVLRRGLVAGRWLGAGVPSCLARVRPGDVLHVEGWFRPALLLPLVAGARRRRCRVVLSPHNTFSRRGRPGEERLVRRMARSAQAVFAFSEPDLRRLREWGAEAVRVPLVFAPPPPDAGLVGAWRRRWRAEGGSGPVVLFAGQVRPDKGLDVLVRAVGGTSDVTLAVVGEDHGALDGATRQARRSGTPLAVDEGFQSRERFLAAVAAADVVACPYLRASQSAVLATAAALRRPTVASDVGGLGELATVVVPPGDAAALRAGIGRALTATPTPPPRWPDVLPRYLEGYGMAAGADG